VTGPPGRHHEAIRRSLARGHVPVPVAGTPDLLIPIEEGRSAAVAVLSGPDRRLRRVIPVGAGHFVHGDDNAVFGRWNAVVAVTGRRAAHLLPGHGGEIIPGRFADHVDRLRDNVVSGRDRPVQVDLDISMACASACTFCFSAAYRSTRRTGRRMTRELLLALVETWAAAGVRVLRFDGGGDPLTHPDLPAALLAAHGLGLRTAVLTAGDLLGPRHLEPLVAARTYLRVSLNAADEATRAAVHRPVSRHLTLERTLAQVRMLDTLRRQAYGGDATTVLPLGATSLVVPGNAGQVYRIAETARDAGFDHLSFRVVLGAAHAVAFGERERAAVAEQFARVRADLTGPGFQVFTPTRPLTDAGYRPARYFTRCVAATHRALVEVGPDPRTAAVVPCGRYRGEGFTGGDRVFGLMTAGTTVDDVWLTPGMSGLLATFPAACGDCIDRSANLMFGGMSDALRSDPAAVFFRFAAAQPTEREE
jgi:hypothetical protein